MFHLEGGDSQHVKYATGADVSEKNKHITDCICQNQN